MFRYVIKKSTYIVLVSALVLFSGCGDIDNDGENTVDVPGSSQFISATVIDDINASTMLNIINNYTDLNTTNAFGFQSAFGYKAVKIVYKTKGQNNEDINASGLLVIPTVMDEYKSALQIVGKSFSVSMLCDNHGTIFKDEEAPSNVETSNGIPDYPLATSMTGYAGFAGIYPDYIGYGESNSVSHPYMLKKSSARASLDMIKASIKYMSDNNIVLNYQLYVSGYSQGGHIAMALAQEIENSFSDSVNLMGVAPMAAPHDLEELANIEINASHIMVYPAFLGYLADSYSFYNNDINLSDLVVEADTAMYHSLFNGDNNNTAIHTDLGLAIDARGGFDHQTADALFKTSFISDYQNNINNLMRQKFIENKSYINWTPRTKVNLVHCVDDEIIPFSMSQNAFNDLNATGANVTLTSLPTTLIDVNTPIALDNPFMHGRCGKTAYGAAVSWFNDIRAERI